MKWRPSLLAAGLLFVVASAHGAPIPIIHVDGAIGPATADYVARGLREAEREQAQCLIIQLDTPGGLLDSTKSIVQSLLASPVPSVVYVAPSGATAASAGCFITLAADIAAMAPATTIGAAHPVEIGGSGVGETKLDDTMKQKLENYGVSYIETIAAKRKRNVEWAKSSVKESAAITAQKAFELKVIDIVAANMDDLLHQLDGRQIGGRTLQTAGGRVVEIPMSFSERVFQKLWRPEVMFILMLVAIYGIIGELSNPGTTLPGVLGAIALVLALYMSAILPVNAAGLALLGVSVVLFVIDVFAPTHGVLTLGGIVAFFIGSMMLFDRNQPGYGLSLGYIIPATLVTGAFFAFAVGKGLRAQRLPRKTGQESMIGRTAKVLAPTDSHGGKVLFDGEYWQATSERPVGSGEVVEIIAVRGLSLRVKLPHP